MSNELKITVISPEKILYSGEAEYVKVPGVKGSFGILKNHAPIVSELEIGVLEIKNSGKLTRMVVDGGFIEVKSNIISVLANSGDLAEQINPEKAKANLAAAEKSNSKTRTTDIKKASIRVKVSTKSEN